MSFLLLAGYFKEKPEMLLYFGKNYGFYLMQVLLKEQKEHDAYRWTANLEFHEVTEESRDYKYWREYFNLTIQGEMKLSCLHEVIKWLQVLFYVWAIEDMHLEFNEIIYGNDEHNVYKTFSFSTTKENEEIDLTDIDKKIPFSIETYIKTNMTTIQDFSEKHMEYCMLDKTSVHDYTMMYRGEFITLYSFNTQLDEVKKIIKDSFLKFGGKRPFLVNLPKKIEGNIDLFPVLFHLESEWYLEIKYKGFWDIYEEDTRMTRFQIRLTRKGIIFFNENQITPTGSVVSNNSVGEVLIGEINGTKFYFDIKKTQLYYGKTVLDSLWQSNELFLKAFFKSLPRTIKDSRSVDQILNQFDNSFDGYSEKKRKKAIKNDFYGRIRILNNKVNDLTGVKKLLSTKSQCVYISRPDLFSDKSEN